MSLKLLTLDETDDARDDLTLAALEAAGRGEGPKAARCKAAFEASIEAGLPRAKAKALAAMRAA